MTSDSTLRNEKKKKEREQIKPNCQQKNIQNHRKKFMSLFEPKSEDMPGSEITAG